MLYDKGEGGFVQEIHKQWPAMRDALRRLIADGGVIDQYYQETKASAVQDYLLRHPDQTDYDYLKQVEKLKSWIRERIEWVDAHLDEVDTMIHKVTFLVDGEVWRTDFRPQSEEVTPNEKHPEPADRTFVAWLDEDGKAIESDTVITTDRVFTAQFVNDSEITHGKDSAFVKASDVIHYNSFFPVAYQIQYEVLPTDADNQNVVWTSSNPDLATVNEFGRVVYNGPGEVTLTAMLKYGTTKTFTLKIVEGEAPDAQSIRPEQSEIEMLVGEQTPCPILTEPSPARISDCTYESANPSIVTVDEFGALTAVAPGQTKVTIRAESYDENGEPITLETEVTVTVSEETQPETVTYALTSEGDLSWAKASKVDLVLTVKRSIADETCFDHFTGVKLDGKLLEKDKDYTVEPGSTVVTLKAATLQKLNVGKHTLEILFDDGQVTTDLNILAAGSATTTTTKTTTSKTNRSARTGDDRSLSLWIALLAAGLGGFSYAWYRLRRE